MSWILLINVILGLFDTINNSFGDVVYFLHLLLAILSLEVFLMMVKVRGALPHGVDVLYLGERRRIARRRSGRCHHWLYHRDARVVLGTYSYASEQATSMSQISPLTSRKTLMKIEDALVTREIIICLDELGRLEVCVS